jgi:hypothetical protein
MKRSPYDSEYDRIRREAGYAKPQYEFSDEDPKPDIARVQAAHEDFKARMAELCKVEEAGAAIRKARSDELSHRANLSVLFDEYHRAGVSAPSVTADGIPTVSLSLLISLGWSIQNYGIEGATLVPPIGWKPLGKEQ